jgi:hypothetical protein
LFQTSQTYILLKKIVVRATILLLISVYTLYQLYQDAKDGLDWQDITIPGIFFIIILIGFVRLYLGTKGGTFVIPKDDEVSKKRLFNFWAKMFIYSMIFWIMAMLIIEENVLDFEIAAVLAVSITYPVFFGYIWILWRRVFK